MDPRRRRTDPKRWRNLSRLITAAVVATLALILAPAAQAAPVVSGVSPNHGPTAGGNTVMVAGSGLITTTEVDFGFASAAIISETNTSITVNAPPGVSGPVHVTVITGGMRSAATDADLYSYDPVVTGLDPAHGPAAGGNQVTIVGVGFTGTPTVMFGNRKATGVGLLGSTTITATAPAGKAGKIVDVTVTTPDGTSNPGAAGDHYTYDFKPKTFLTHHPRRRSHKRKVAFAFDSNAQGAKFKCFDARGWAKCRSPRVFRHLKPGRYKFKVKAIAGGVADPTPATFIFRILR
jgi:hypothetical protein